MPRRNRTDFSPSERRGVYRAIYERRDIRSHFLPEPVPDHVLARLLDAAHHGPSVGFMQPRDFIVIRDAAMRRAIHASFVEAKARGAAVYQGERRALYESLKLAGILEAPVNLCVTCDRGRAKGAGLGRQTDPATDLYSTACAVQNLWLAARAESLGVGWVSILDFDRLRGLNRLLATEVDWIALIGKCDQRAKWERFAGAISGMFGEKHRAAFRAHN